MPEFLRRLFSADGFMPHGHCYFWNPEVVWLHVVSDGLIAASYMTIPFTLTYFIRKRKDLPFPLVFWAFGLFIVSCGVTHIMEIWTLWTPRYWLSGAIKAITAATSVTTAVVLVRLLPEALKIPSPQLLREAHGRLTATEARFRAASEQMKDAFYILDCVKEGGKVVDLRLVEVNEAGVARHAKSRKDMVGELYSKLYSTGASDALLERFVNVAVTGKAYEGELRITDPTIRARWVHVRVVSLGNGVAITSTDITERRRAEEERDGFFRLSLDMLCIAGFDGRFKRLNPAWTSAFGWTAEEMLAKPWIDFVHPDDRAATEADRADVIRGASPAAFESRFECKNGDYKVLSWRSAASPNEKVIYASVRDVTSTREAERELRKSSLEREVLLKEIHHRVKNNLQVISSLLKLHAEKVTDLTAQSAFHDSQDRVRAIALLHEQLYQSKSLADVDITTYAETLVHTLLRANADNDVRLSIDGKGISLPMDSAVPFGLIFNELVMNCLKHGRTGPGGNPAKIRVEMREVENDLELLVADNGAGFPAGFDVGSTKSLGMHLIRSLAGQLEGEVRFASVDGAEARFRFPAPHREDAS